MADSARWLQVTDAAAHLDVGRQAVIAMISRGDLACRQVRTPRWHYEVSAASLEAFIAARELRVGPRGRKWIRRR